MVSYDWDLDITSRDCMEYFVNLLSEDFSPATEQFSWTWLEETSIREWWYIPRVFGLYCKLRTEFFPSIYGPRDKSMKKNEDP